MRKEHYGDNKKVFFSVRVGRVHITKKKMGRRADRVSFYGEFSAAGSGYFSSHFLIVAHGRLSFHRSLFVEGTYGGGDGATGDSGEGLVLWRQGYR